MTRQGLIAQRPTGQPGQVGSVEIRFAGKEDIPAIAALINIFAAQNLMLPRSEAQVAAALPDFLVAKAAGRVVACGSLIGLTPYLAEIRSLAVAVDYHGSGLGSRLVAALVELARERDLEQVCALTLRPNFFQRLGFQVVDRWNLTPKIWRECVYCPKFHRCDEVAMLLNLVESARQTTAPPWWRVLADRAPLPLLRRLAPR